MTRRMPRVRWLDPDELANHPTCKFCGKFVLPAGFGPCDCPQAMAEHRRIMGSDR